MATYKLYPSAREKRLAKLRRLAKVRLRQTSAIGAFMLCVFVFATLFSTFGKDYLGSASNTSLSTRATAGEIGTSSPLGEHRGTKSMTPTAVANHAASLGITSAGSAVLGIATAKPAWTNLQLYRDPGNEASTYAAANPTDPKTVYITRMGLVPVAEWFGDWNSNVTSDAEAYVSAAAAINSVPVLVLYNIPERDCGGYSTGGATSVANYVQWVKEVTAGIGSRTAVVILEPDALGALDCLSSADQQSRIQALSQAVTILKAQPNTSVYIDAGTPVWQSTTTMATRLKAANVADADGFSINVSYFLPTSRNQSYGDQLSALIGYKHYVIDTSRNGTNRDVTGAVCNPSYAAFGTAPTADTGDALNDALLWIKIPWESDGPCNGSPDPGVPYWSYAVQLAKNAGW